MLNRRRAIHGASGGDVPDNPSGYMFVEYIESVGAQYIDLGMLMDSGYRFECDIAFTSDAGSQYYGVIENTTNNLKKRIQFGCGNKKLTIYSSPSYSDIFTIDFDNERHVYKMTGFMSSIDDAGIGTTGSYPVESMYLFACNNRGVADMFTYSKCYGFKVYDSFGYTVAELVPSIRLSDSKPGMYDLMTGAFYENMGADEFMWG